VATLARVGKLAIVGVGLIGGSFALAARAAGCVGQITGVGRSRANLERAKALGVIDADATLAEAVRGADVVLLAMPVGATAAVLRAIAPHLHAGTVVTDAGSTKSDVVAAARDALGERLPRFVPGHPIAGAEQSGVDAARAGLFSGKRTVLTPLDETDADAREIVRELWRACGAEVHEMAPATHDQVFAAVSHLPHLIAYALVHDIELSDSPDIMFPNRRPSLYRLM